MRSALAEAIAFAQYAHKDQLDKTGQPFIGHPLRVMGRLAERLAFSDPPHTLPSSDDGLIVAVLHDVLEDRPDLSVELTGMPWLTDTLLEALQAITKNEGERYSEYIVRCAEHPVARAVKIADILDNSDPRRVAPKHDLRSRYRAAWPKLTSDPLPPQLLEDCE